MKTKFSDRHAQRAIKTIHFLKRVYLALTFGSLALWFHNDAFGTKIFCTLLLLVGWWCIWYTYYRAKYDFVFFGVENIQLVGASMSEIWRDMVWERGYITLE